MQSGVQFHSSDPVLNTRFDWARKQALACVHDHAPIGPVYEAALPGREAFCMRDTSARPILWQPEGAETLITAAAGETKVYARRAQEAKG
jgi:hypothetical protein